MQSEFRDQEITNVLFVAAEAEPFIKIGGLGDVAGSLPKSILEFSQSNSDNKKLDIRLVLPYHQAIKAKNFEFVKIGVFEITSKKGKLNCDVYFSDKYDVPTYLLDNKFISNDASVYHADPTLDGYKYISFSICVLELSKFLNWQIDILHANDWHTAPAIYALRTRYKNDPFFNKTRSLLTMHNLPYMGWGTQAAMDLFGLNASKSKRLPDWAKHAPLPLGILTADKVVTVSPTYAKEILTPQFGCSLQDFLQSEKNKIIGILNGIDEKTWNPANDPQINTNFDANNISAKYNNKTELQKRFRFKVEEEIPLLTLVSRMDQQKGIDIALNSLKELISFPWQAVILGTGDPVIERLALDLASHYPKRIAVVNEFAAQLAHQFYAGADIFLMPSRYEPCGLSQMISMKYGTVPVAHNTGGLADTIIDFDAEPLHATGFLFSPAEKSAFNTKLIQAMKIFQEKLRWKSLMANGMKSDFSWSKSAEAYIEEYRSLIQKKD